MDFDGTITRRDTLGMFGRFVAGRRRYLRAVLKASPWLAGWKMGLVDHSKAREHLFSNLFRGMRAEDFERYGRMFADRLEHVVRKKSMRVIKGERGAGDILVIVSASMGAWIRPWASRHGIDEVICSEPEIDERGLLTGRFATPNCYGAEKRRRFLERFPDREDYELTAYGDSAGDREMLEEADHPVWVRSRGSRMDLTVFGWFMGVSLMLALAAFWAWNRYMTTPPYVDPQRFPVRGIDVSSHNGMMNLDAAAADGVEFIFIKATEGADFRDPNFALNYLKAGHAGMKRGAYHFFRFDRDGVEQAMNLLKAVAGRPLELGVAVDVEEHGNARNVPMDSIQQRLQDMTDFLNLKGYRVTFYSNRDGYSDFLYQNFRGFPLWVCSFTDNSANTDWTFWQYDHHGKVAGIRGDVDLNVFSGDRDQWEAHLRESAE